MRRVLRQPGLHDARGDELPHRLVNVDGVDTFLYDAGDGPPVVLIHGYGDTADGWRRVAPGLLPHHRVVALDVPPFGRSGEPPWSGRLIDFYKGFVPELFARLEIDRATVIGHSLGGAIALNVALEHPQLVERLGLVAPAGLGTAAPWWWHLLDGYPLWHAALSIPSPITPMLIRQGMRRFLDARLVHDARKLKDDIGHLLSMHSTAKDFDRLLRAGRCCIESYSGRLLERSARLRIPVWMVWGRHDGLVPFEHALAFRQANEGAAVHVFEDCGHYPHIELPGRFNHLLRDWMIETRPEPGRRLKVVEAA
jgi:pimeloyl-ACP methyl ester carboxylesterase